MSIEKRKEITGMGGGGAERCAALIYEVGWVRELPRQQIALREYAQCVILPRRSWAFYGVWSRTPSSLMNAVLSRTIKSKKGESKKPPGAGPRRRNTRSNP